MLNGFKCSFKTNEVLEKCVKYVEIHFVFSSFSLILFHQQFYVTAQKVKFSLKDFFN